ncbi:hypothetical protein CLOM_g998 [Closterium sp. NIES-68]|nr:hypothetical protein CLOM_g998 [Closterium sp. NIES-68]GJP85063.1 hypothetical protein CLOP_g15166 [Closterium sp. NIES-67]
MDSNLVEDWVQHVLLPFIRPPAGVARSKTLLVLDSYRGHLTDTVRGLLRWHRITPAIIPGGCAPLLQPLDVCVNRSFKAGVRTHYNGWFVDEGIEFLTTAGSLRKPPLELVLRWIAAAWEAVPEDIIIKSFKTCGISNATDGTEDHLILAHMQDGAQVEVHDDVHAAGDVEEWINPLYVTGD